MEWFYDGVSIEGARFNRMDEIGQSRTLSLMGFTFTVELIAEAPLFNSSLSFTADVIMSEANISCAISSVITSFDK